MVGEMIYNSSKLPSLRFQNKSCPYSILRFGSIYPPGYRKTRLPSHAHIWFFSKIGSLAQEHYRASQFRITHSIRSLYINSPIFFIPFVHCIYVFFSQTQVFHGVPICDTMFNGIEQILIQNCEQFCHKSDIYKILLRIHTSDQI